MYVRTNLTDGLVGCSRCIVTACMPKTRRTSQGNQIASKKMCPSLCCSDRTRTSSNTVSKLIVARRAKYANERLQLQQYKIVDLDGA